MSHEGLAEEEEEEEEEEELGGRAGGRSWEERLDELGVRKRCGKGGDVVVSNFLVGITMVAPTFKTEPHTPRRHKVVRPVCASRAS
jgi:hypothetical protein